MGKKEERRKVKVTSIFQAMREAFLPFTYKKPVAADNKLKSSFLWEYKIY